MKNLKEQYKNESNLEKRIQIHQYGTSKESWFEFLARNITFTDNCTILEIGCGTGALWKNLLHSRPAIKKIVLSDFSEGMLTKTRDTMAEFEQIYDIEYKKIDATSIPYENGSFDVVIANHVLYHISDSQKALSEISRVLNSKGIFFATTIGKDNMNELKLIIEKYFPNLDNNLFFNKFLENFSLENAISKTDMFFKNSLRVDYEDNLIIPDPKPIIDYIESLELPSILDSDDSKIDFNNKLSEDYNFAEGFLIRKEIGLIRCEK